MYPPNPDEIHCVTMSQIAELTTKVAGDTPCPRHGDMAANPNPDPNVKSTRDIAAATKAPAIMADQDTPA
jgi:hypothetical protein